MSTFDRIKIIAKRRGLSLVEVNDKAGLGVRTIYHWAKTDPSDNNLKAVANVLNTTVDYLRGRTNNPAPVSNITYLGGTDTIVLKIPVIGTIACGEPITADQNIENYTSQIFTTKPAGTLFALKCKGQSMEPTIPDGSVVIVREQPEVEDGEIAAVQLHSDNNDFDVATLKRVKHTDNGVVLEPDNKSFSPIILDKNSHARIIGKAIRIVINL